jgi:AcrR family transcriptional regulator
MTPSTSSGPGRKRSESSRQSILQAALSLASEEGLSRVTMDSIAARAGVGKQTIYRWWTSKAAVVLEALTESAAEQIPSPRGASLRHDLASFVRATFASISAHPGNAQLLRGLMAQAQSDDGFRAEFRERFLDRRREALREVFERARARHELQHGFDPELGVDLVFGAMWYRLLVGHGPIDRRLASQLAQVVAGGASGKAARL